MNNATTETVNASTSRNISRVNNGITLLVYDLEVELGSWPSLGRYISNSLTSMSLISLREERASITSLLWSWGEVFCCVLMTSREVLMTSRVVLMTSRVALIISRGALMTSRCALMTSRCALMTSRGVVMTSRGVVMTSRVTEVTRETRGGMSRAGISGARVTTGESWGGRAEVETGVETMVQGAGTWAEVVLRGKGGEVTADCWNCVLG